MTSKSPLKVTTKPHDQAKSSHAMAKSGGGGGSCSHTGCNCRAPVAVPAK